MISRLATNLNALLRDETGQDMVEYALIAALIGLGVVLSMKSLAGKLGFVFTTIGTDLTSAA